MSQMHWWSTYFWVKHVWPQLPWCFLRTSQSNADILALVALCIWLCIGTFVKWLHMTSKNIINRFGQNWCHTFVTLPVNGRVKWKAFQYKISLNTKLVSSSYNKSMNPKWWTMCVTISTDIYCPPVLGLNKII